MKRFLKPKLIFSLVLVVVLASAIVIPLAHTITHSHAAGGAGTVSSAPKGGTTHRTTHRAPKASPAANGDLVHETNFSTSCQSGIGVGIAFDGTNLWYICYRSNPDLFKAQPLTGTVIASYNIAWGLGALA